jgi:hypothetical protein
MELTAFLSNDLINLLRVDIVLRVGLVSVFRGIYILATISICSSMLQSSINRGDYILHSYSIRLLLHGRIGDSSIPQVSGLQVLGEIWLNL